VDPVTTHVTIGRSPHEVFDYLADVANHPEFLDHFMTEPRLTRVESYGTGAGIRFKVDKRFNRFGWGDYTLIRVEPHHRIIAVGRSGKYNRVKTYYEWRLSPAGDGTRVELTAESEPAMPSDRLFDPLGGRGWFKRRAAKGLKRLRNILEDGQDRGRRATVGGL
jgi:uncharacterized protein YndB with AHSA1/START domain